MIKLKQLIKEETIHSCECGGDCCSVNESKGMELGKIFTGHGFAFKKEELEDESCGYTDEIGIDEPELEEGFEKYHLGNLLDSKLKKRLESFGSFGNTSFLHLLHHPLFCDRTCHFLF